ncbi:MAG: hypothetical protein HYS13_14245, partial [Planctomycetia bacterium]|nr:hypothetical protein [Planctomycetia bacterium]
MTDIEVQSPGSPRGDEPPEAGGRKVVLAIDEEPESLTSLVEALCGAAASLDRRKEEERRRQERRGRDRRSQQRRAAGLFLEH